MAKTPKKRASRDLHKIGPLNRVTLPRSVMEALKLEIGDYVQFEVEGTTARIYGVDVRRRGSPLSFGHHSDGGKKAD